MFFEEKTQCCAKVNQDYILWPFKQTRPLSQKKKVDHPSEVFIKGLTKLWTFSKIIYNVYTKFWLFLEKEQKHRLKEKKLQQWGSKQLRVLFQVKYYIVYLVKKPFLWV